jgi:hypothetical protein
MGLHGHCRSSLSAIGRRSACFQNSSRPVERDNCRTVDSFVSHWIVAARHGLARIYNIVDHNNNFRQ